MAGVSEAVTNLCGYCIYIDIYVYCISRVMCICIYFMYNVYMRTQLSGWCV